MIVEKDDDVTPVKMDALRRKAGKPDIPVWFVAFGKGRKWADSMAVGATRYAGMSVTWSSAGEYANALDVASPTVVA